MVEVQNQGWPHSGGLDLACLGVNPDSVLHCVILVILLSLCHSFHIHGENNNRLSDTSMYRIYMLTVGVIFTIIINIAASRGKSKDLTLSSSSFAIQV